MKHLLTILSGLLVALLFARCADDDNLSGGIDGLPERGIVIRLSTGELDTRTQLTSTGDYHHVEEVWAVLYKWNGNESADPTTDPNNHGNYYFESATRLNLEDGSPWNPYDERNDTPPERGDYNSEDDYKEALDAYNNKWGGEYGNGKVQGREFVLPESEAMQAGTYRVLCIGFDEASKTVYDLMSGETLNPSIFGTNGTNSTNTLADAKATLTETKAYEEQTGTYQMYGYDGTGELFAGWTEFEFEPDNINIAEVELKRRVAGILCYVTDIPVKIESTEVKGIRLCLNTKANSEIGLCRLDKPWEDFGAEGGGDASSYGGTTLAYRDLSDWTAEGEILKNDEGKNLTMGVYLIPIDVVNDSELDGNFNTLSVQLFGGENYEFNEETGEVTGGELIKTFNVLNEQGHSTDRGETAERYNILPNYIYHIGNKDDDIDEPMSLLGQKITVKPKKWTGETIPVEFPSVPIKPRVEVEGIPEGRILDCIGREITIVVTNSVLKEDWVLHSDGGIYFPTGNVSGENISCTNKYSATADDLLLSEVRIPAILTDYAKITNLPIEDDHRTIRLSVMVGSEEKAFVEFKQYNAIIVEMHDDDDDRDVNLAFSRFDWNQQHIDEASARQRWPWGYDNITPGFIYGNGASAESSENGRTNYIAAKSGREADMWDDSAIYRCARYGYQAETATSGITVKKKEAAWYLPAYNELDAFLKAAGTAKKNSQSFDAYNIVIGSDNTSDYNKYWTSNVVGSLLRYSWCYWLDNTGTVVYDYDVSGSYDNNLRTQEYYMRNCSRDVEPAN